MDAIAATRPEPAQLATIQRLIETVTEVAGYRPVSDQFWADLVHGTAAPLATVRVGSAAPEHELIGYAQATARGSVWTVETVVDPGRNDDQVAAVLDDLLQGIEDTARAKGAEQLGWLVQGPTHVHEAVASHHRFVPVRRLHQMRRALPTGLGVDLVTRPFDPQRDIDAWVQVNARAFAWNPEQGSWTAEHVRARMNEEWFDPQGFLIHERDGAIAGFCWTKIHTDTSPVMGEIYVIAVDPDYHGLGLGRALTLAGLDHIARHGIDTAMLFVDAANTTAIRLYEALGFVTHRTDSMFMLALNELTDTDSTSGC